MIKNLDLLIRNARTPVDAEARRVALTLVEAAVSAVDPRNLVQKRVKLNCGDLDVSGVHFNLAEYNRIVVGGAGKASGAMAEALEQILGGRIDEGLINVPKGTAENFKTEKICLQEAGHPIPDEGGLNGAQAIVQLLSNLDEKILVFFLLSGGGSALLPLPKQGISLAEKKATTDLLLKCGATIEEVNTVRKHISAVKGGQLAANAYPASLICLVLSDIVGDPIASIASGPTVPDPTTYDQAVEILKRYGVWDKVPTSVSELLKKGFQGEVQETPKPGDPRFEKVHNIILGNNRFALSAAKEKAAAMGLNPFILSSFIEGEARHIGTAFAGLSRELQVECSDASKHRVLLAGGETTVTVIGKGRGGRNHELALSASLRLRGMEGISLVSVGTDGVDGLSDAAGAIVDGSTINHALELDLNPLVFLADNDSHTFFSTIGDGIMTGPTGTNVNDILFIVNLKGKE